MTTARYNRCAHCNTIYLWYPSSYGTPLPKYNSGTHCELCNEVMVKALNQIPLKFEKKWIITTDYTKQQIINAQNERISKSKIPVKRVMPGLFDMKNPDNIQSNVCEPMIDPNYGESTNYVARWWSKEPNNIEIKKQIWWDIENNCIAKNQKNFQ